jgi:hypothetical protein
MVAVQLIVDFDFLMILPEVAEVELALVVVVDY